MDFWFVDWFYFHNIEWIQQNWMKFNAAIPNCQETKRNSSFNLILEWAISWQSIKAFKKAFLDWLGKSNISAISFQDYLLLPYFQTNWTRFPLWKQMAAFILMIE